MMNHRIRAKAQDRTAASTFCPWCAAMHDLLKLAAL
jgi:hypothetical protein